MEEPGDADVPLSKAPDRYEELVTCLRGVSCLLQSAAGRGCRKAKVVRKMVVNERFCHHFPFSQVFLEEHEELLP